MRIKHRKFVRGWSLAVMGVLPFICGCQGWSYRHDLDGHMRAPVRGKLTDQPTPAKEGADAELTDEPAFAAESPDEQESDTQDQAASSAKPNGMSPGKRDGSSRTHSTAQRHKRHKRHRFGHGLAGRMPMLWPGYMRALMTPPPESQEMVQPRPRFHPLPTQPVFQPPPEPELPPHLPPGPPAAPSPEDTTI